MARHLSEALSRQHRPGSQFTSFDFTITLKDAGIRIPMGGRGRWMDNVFIERLWRCLKYERVLLAAFETGSEARSCAGALCPVDDRLKYAPVAFLARLETAGLFRAQGRK